LPSQCGEYKMRVQIIVLNLHRNKVNKVDQNKDSTKATKV
jgi:hypothetical protein